MASGFFAVLDDIAFLMDDVVLASKIAISSKTAKIPDAILIKCRRSKVLKNVIF